MIPIKINDNVPVELQMTIRRGDTLLYYLDIRGPNREPLAPEVITDLMTSEWRWQVRGRKPDGANLGEIQVKAVPVTGGVRLACFMPTETSSNLLVDPRVNLSDLQRIYTRYDYRMVDTLVNMPIVASADITKLSITTGGI